jgi:gliding motility-associated-like protein
MSRFGKLLLVLFVLIGSKSWGQCDADIGTHSATFNGSSITFGTTIYLCEGDNFSILAEDYVLPDRFVDATNNESSELIWSIHNCTPTQDVTPEGDACYTGSSWTADNFTDENTASSVLIGAFGETGIIYYLTPITVDDGDNDPDTNDGIPENEMIGIDNNGDGCWDYDPNVVQPVAYLNSIDFEVTSQCDGTVEITVTGGKMEVTATNYSVTNTGNGSLVTSAVSHGGSISISGLSPGDSYSINVDDETNCPANFSGTYSGPYAGEDGAAEVCVAGSSFDLFDQLGGTPDAGGSWTTPSSAASDGTFVPGTSEEGTYTYTVPSTTDCPASTATVSVSVEQLPDAGEDGTVDFCTNGTSEDLFNSLNGTPITGGSWTGPSGSHSGTYDPVSNSPGDYTYTVVGDLCASNPVSAIVTVEEVEAPDPGEDGTHELCETEAAFDLIDFLGGSPESGGSWTGPTNAAFGDSFDPSSDTPGIYTYTVSGTDPCQAESATVTVSVETLPNAGTDGSTNICSTDEAITLFDLLGDNPDAGGAWTDPSSASHSGNYDPSTDATGNYTYTVTGTLCIGSPVSAVVSVTEIVAPEAGDNSSTTICETEPSFDMVSLLGGTPDAGGSWTDPSDVAFDGSFDASTDSPGAYTYTVSGTDPCEDVSSVLTIAVEDLPDAGENASTTVCGNDDSFDLFSLLGGTPENDGSWSNPDATSHSGTYDPTSDDQGDYTYTVEGTVCVGETDESIVTVTEIVPPNPGEANSISVCESDASLNLTDQLNGTPDAGGTWTNSTGITISETFDPGSGESGVYTYEVAGTDPCEDDNTQLTISISTVPDPGTDGENELCDNDESFVLNDFLNGTPESDGVWTNPLGEVVTSTLDPSSSESGDYTYTVSNAPCVDETAIVNVIINLAPVVNAGEDVTIQPGESHQINASVTGEDEFNWSPSGSLSDPFSTSPVATPDESTTYTLSASTTKGCERSDEITVLVKGQLEIPTGFTPNNDGVNDEWELENIEFFPNAEIKVYSRWGNLVFSASGSDPFWDGTSLGMKVPEATYWYVITTNDIDYPDPLHGTVSIFR